MASKTSETLRRFRLTELIDALRNDLIEYNAAKCAEHQPIFKVKEASVEASVEAQAEKNGKVGVTFWILHAGAGAAQKSRTNCRITIKLEPLEMQGTKTKSSVVLGARKKKKKLR